MIGIIVRAITFPGALLRTLLLSKACGLLGLEVMETQYISATSEESIAHEVPQELSKSLGLALIPFVSMSLLSLIMFDIGVYRVPMAEGFFIWLGVSIATHSFPESRSATWVWEQSVKNIRSGNYIAILAIPLSIVFHITRILHFVWLDVIYGILLFMLVQSEAW